MQRIHTRKLVCLRRGFLPVPDYSFLKAQSPKLSVTLHIFLSIFQNPGKPGPDTQNSSAELINGLVQLVPQTNMPEIGQEAMEVRNLISVLELSETESC